MDLKPFARFLRPTGKGLATRYGTSPPLYIGARRDPETGELTIDTTVIVALTHDEAGRYRREYNRAIAEGALEEVKAAAYLAHVGGDKKASKRGADG